MRKVYDHQKTKFYYSERSAKESILERELFEQMSVSEIYSSFKNIKDNTYFKNMEIIEIVGTLVMLIALQLVLGFDNLLYIALESKKAPKEKQTGHCQKSEYLSFLSLAIGRFHC